MAGSIWGQGGGGVVGVVGLLTVGEGGSEKWRVSRIYNRGWHLCFPGQAIFHAAKVSLKQKDIKF